ncbi:class I SAM-dependent methyltransferase [Elusimicrobiota bacterium]
MISKPENWDKIADKEQKSPYIDKILGIYKREEHIKLINKWMGKLSNIKILKTDLHEEALGSDHILFHLAGQDNAVFAIDISQKIVDKAKERAEQYGIDAHNYIAADVRHLPFEESLFDLVISTSTLDHFPEKDLKTSLSGLKRVLKPDGILILTVNNKQNYNFFIMLKLGRLLRIIPYPVKFYSREEISDIAEGTGFIVEETASIVHIPCPLNKMLILGKKLISSKIIDKWTSRSINIFKKSAKGYRTAWFIALKLRKT